AFSQEVDGIMGPRSFYTFWYLGQMLQDSKKLRDVFVKGGGNFAIFDVVLKDDEKVQQSVNHALAEIIKPEVTSRWEFAVKPSVGVNFIYSDLSWLGSYAKQESAFGELMSGETFTKNKERASKIREKLDRSFFVMHRSKITTDEDRMGVLSLLYQDEEKLSGEAILYEADRDFVHSRDLKRIFSKSGGSGFDFQVIVYDPSSFAEIVGILGLQGPSSDEAMGTALKILHSKPGEIDDTPEIAALGISLNLPKRSQKQIHKAVDDYLVRKAAMEKKRREEELELGLKKHQEIQKLQKQLDDALKGDPDVTDVKVLMGLLGAVNGASGLKKLKALAEKKGFLVVKIGISKPFPLFNKQIEDIRSDSENNWRFPLRFGLAPPEDDSDIPDRMGFNAKKRKDGKIAVSRYPSRLTYDSRTSSRTGPVSGDWKYAPITDVYDPLEPVLVEIVQLNPGTTALVWMLRDLLDEDVYVSKRQWVLAQSLPQVAESLWDKKEMEDVMDTVDIIFTAGALGSVVTAPLKVGHAAFANMARTTVSREVLKASLTFVVTETLAMKFVEFDYRVNELERDKYSKEDRENWGYFKVALLLFMAGAISLSAMRGAYKYYLHNASSPRMKSAIKALQEEFEAQAKAEGRVVGDDVAKGVTQSAQVDAKVRSNKVMSQMFPDATAKGGSEGLGQQAAWWNPFSKNASTPKPEFLKKPWTSWHKIDAQIAAKDALDARTVTEYTDITVNDARVAIPQIYSGPLTPEFAQVQNGRTYLRINGIDVESLVARLKSYFNQAHAEALTVIHRDREWWDDLAAGRHNGLGDFPNTLDRVAWANHLASLYTAIRAQFDAIDNAIVRMNTQLDSGTPAGSFLIDRISAGIMVELENFASMRVPGHPNMFVFNTDIARVAGTLVGEARALGRLEIPTQAMLNDHLRDALQLFPVPHLEAALLRGQSTDAIRLGHDYAWQQVNGRWLDDVDHIVGSAAATYDPIEQVIRVQPTPISQAVLREFVVHETYHAWFHESFPFFVKLNKSFQQDVMTKLALFFNENNAYRSGLRARQDLMDNAAMISQYELNYLATQANFKGFHGRIKKSIGNRKISLSVYYAAILAHKIFVSLPKAGQEYLIKRPTDWMFR
ncbi:MAG: hypothetical protein AAGA18_15275, partial [Verrucomicrobiota bacterium]